MFVCQSDLDDPTLLLINTRQNELVLEYQRQMEQRSLDSPLPVNQRYSSQSETNKYNVKNRRVYF
jgi:hypothetical protein